MPGESFIKMQWKLRDKSDRPSEYAIDRAESCCTTLSLSPVVRLQHCFDVAKEVDQAYQRGQHAQETAPSPGVRGVIDLQSHINVLVTQVREALLAPGPVSFWAVEAVQDYFASPSAADTLVPFCRDLASAIKTTPQAVGLAVLAGQPLALSMGNFGTTTYPVAMPDGATLTLAIPTLEGLTGNIPNHTWENWLAGFRQRAGHTPRQHILTEEVQKKKVALRIFLDEQKRQGGWTPEGGWPQRQAPHGFWPAMAQEWKERFPQWGDMSSEALRKEDKRVPQQTLHDASERRP